MIKKSIVALPVVFLILTAFLLMPGMLRAKDCEIIYSTEWDGGAFSTEELSRTYTASAELLMWIYKDSSTYCAEKTMQEVLDSCNNNCCSLVCGEYDGTKLCTDGNLYVLWRMRIWWDWYISGSWNVVCVDECVDDSDCAEGYECLLGSCEPMDSDLDGVIDIEDNCLEIANADQADQDDDGIGDVCDIEPIFFWPTLTENEQVAGSVVLMEDSIVFDTTLQSIIWTTRDPDAPSDGLGWASRLGVAHSYVSYREVDDPTWSNEEETVLFTGLGYFGRWSWVYPAREIPANGNYEIKLISEDADGFRSEEVYTIEVAIP